MTARPTACVLLGLALASPAAAGAQPRGPFLRPHAIEVDLGGAWLGGGDAGAADATLTRNQSPRAPYTLFSTSSALRSAAAAEGRIGFHLTRSLAIEGAFVFARPTLETAITGDTEGAPNVRASETLTRIMADVSGVLHLRALHTGRAVPFLLGGVGYLRELHEGNVVAENGRTYHLGGGVKVPLVIRRGFIRSLGVRLDARAYFRSGGADLDPDEPTRATGAASASLIVEF